MNTWTADPPTQSGLYWAAGLGEVVIVEVVMYSMAEASVFETGDETDRGFKNYSHWMGPITPPELPAQ